MILYFITFSPISEIEHRQRLPTLTYYLHIICRITEMNHFYMKKYIKNLTYKDKTQQQKPAQKINIQSATS